MTWYITANPTSTNARKHAYEDCDSLHATRQLRVLDPSEANEYQACERCTGSDGTPANSCPYCGEELTAAFRYHVDECNKQ